MFKVPSKETLRALANLQGDQNFERVLDWIRESRNELAHAMAYQMQGPHFHQQQGGYQVMDKFLDHADKANQSIKHGSIRPRPGFPPH